MLTLTREQVRAIDQLAIEDLGIPGIVLMENASRQVAEAVIAALPVEPSAARVAILCGGGNNGGDGLAVARHLHNRGVKVSVFLAREPGEVRGDAAINLEIVCRMKLDLRTILTAAEVAAAVPLWAQAHVIVDALLGTGFTGEVRGILAEVIRECNEIRGQAQGVKVVAVDVPSGLDCDTGRPSNATIRADVTVTFVAAKPGLIAPGAREYVGKLIVADIGAPPELKERVRGAT
jgi:NAD(P)H-hydrate epimerase